MNSKDAIETIDAICEKLGIAINSFSDFIPELARQRISISAFWITASIIVIFLSAYAIKHVIQRAKKAICDKNGKYCYYDLQDFPSVITVSAIGSILIVIFLFVFLCNVRNIVAWISSPQASAINYILGFLNN